jgi:transcriptional regulator of met regulon
MNETILHNEQVREGITMGYFAAQSDLLYKLVLFATEGEKCNKKNNARKEKNTKLNRKRRCLFYTKDKII